MKEKFLLHGAVIQWGKYIKQINTYRITNCDKCYEEIAQRVVRENNKVGAVTFNAVCISVLPLIAVTKRKAVIYKSWTRELKGKKWAVAPFCGYLSQKIVAISKQGQDWKWRRQGKRKS